VLVDVSVLRGRAAVTDLTPADFSVTDNADFQNIESLVDASIPLDVSLVVDATWYTLGLAGSAGGPAGTDILRRNAQQIAAMLRPDDRLGVITFAAQVVETRPMSPVGENAVQLSLANPTTWAYESRPRVTQALLTALTAPVASDRRHVVVVFSAARGVNDAPSEEQLSRVAERADVQLFAVLNPPLYSVDKHVPFPTFPSEQLIRDSITKAADATGGKAYLTGDIVGAFRDILKQFRSSYVLRYSLQGVPSAGWHDIVVKLPSCPTCTIRARRGYVGR
jgi:VWFA-related protein